MSKYEKLNEFFNNMLTFNINESKNTDNYQYREMRQEYIKDLLETNLTCDEHELVEEILFELQLTADNDANMLYQQGIKDGVWLLKHLEVLS